VLWRCQRLVAVEALRCGDTELVHVTNAQTAKWMLTGGTLPGAGGGACDTITERAGDGWPRAAADKAGGVDHWHGVVRPGSPVPPFDRCCCTGTLAITLFL